jgi:hypothetical protein
MTFLLPLELADPEIRLGLERAVNGAREIGTPFLSSFNPPEQPTAAPGIVVMMPGARDGYSVFRYSTSAFFSSSDNSVPKPLPSSSCPPL